MPDDVAPVHETWDEYDGDGEQAEDSMEGVNGVDNLDANENYDMAMTYILSMMVVMNFLYVGNSLVDRNGDGIAESPKEDPAKEHPEM